MADPNTLQDFRTLDIDVLTAIVDKTTDANKEHMKDKIMIGLASVAKAVCPPGHVYVGQNLGDPYYDNLQDALDNGDNDDSASNVADLVVHVTNQLDAGDMTISANRSFTLIRGLSKNDYYILATVNLSSMYFKDIRIVVSNNILLRDCVFDNCIIEGSNSGNTLNLNGTVIESSTLHTLTDLILTDSIISSSKILCDIELLEGNIKVYNNMIKGDITETVDNLTPEFNVKITNL